MTPGIPTKKRLKTSGKKWKNFDKERFQNKSTDFKGNQTGEQWERG